MKGFNYISGLAGLFFLAAVAVPTMAAKHDPGAALQNTVSQLDLSSAQQDKINTIISDFSAKAKAIHQEGVSSGDMDTAKTKMKDARHDAIKKISAQLTDDQKTKFHDLLQQAEQAHKAKKADAATTQPAQQ